jgi:hypothetical protein
MIAMKKRSIRRTLIIVGGLTAVGVGTYFGVKHVGNKAISQIKLPGDELKNITNHLTHISGHLFDIKGEINHELDYREKMYNAIAAAMHEGVDFKYFEDLGVVFRTVADRDKVVALMQDPEIRKTWA